MKNLFTTLLVVFSINALAQIGLPDVNFGVNGVATVNLGDDDQLLDIKTLSNGKILCLSKSREVGTSDYYPTVSRLNPDGSLDVAFGNSGFVQLPTLLFLGNKNLNIDVDAQSRIIVAFGTNDDIEVFRLLESGSVDTDFSFDGKVTIDFLGSNDVLGDIAIQSDGKILVAATEAGGNDFAIAKLNSDGTFDSSFGTNGKQVHNVTAIDVAEGITLQSDGKILVCGESDNGFGNMLAVIRMNTDASLDVTFNGDGKVTKLISAQDYAYSVAVDANGKILLAGKVNGSGLVQNGIVVRFNADGSEDLSFGTNGSVTVNFSSLADVLTTMILQPDGKILTGGLYDIISGGDQPFWVTRINNDGTFDTDFSQDGSTTVALTGISFSVNSMGLTPNGDLIVGAEETSGNGDLRLLKLKTGLNIGINDLEAVKVSVYPNPTTDVLNLDLNDFEPGQKAIRIFDGTGRLVLETSTTRSNYKLEVETLIDGIYTGTIITENGAGSIQFSKN